MRKGAATTARAVAEHATGAEEVSKAAQGLTRLIGSVARAMTEQAAAATQITAAVDSMRRQSEEAARALAEQARAMRDISAASTNTAKQIKRIGVSNKDHVTGAARVVERLKDIRSITDRNARGVKATRGGTSDLLRHAEALVGELQSRAGRRPRGHNGANGRG
jgi:methyl-accepting chemotaxis protein